MNLYMLNHNQVIRHGRFMCAIVVAESDEDARNIHPCTDEDLMEGHPFWHRWVPQSEVIVKYLGVAAPELNRGVILASVAY